MRRNRMNTAPPCHSDFFGVAASRTGLRIRNDKVVGSIPTSSTIFQSLANTPHANLVTLCHTKLNRLAGSCLKLHGAGEVCTDESGC